VTLASDVGDRITAARKAAGVSRAELGRRIGGKCGYETIAQYERGQRTPTVERLVEIAVALRIEPGTLLDGVRLI
jgi:transcriptional regulator with XRE-family HTH domain